MRLERLDLTRFRGFNAVQWRPGPGINLITGGNGAGKTSLLEAAHLLANGRSFRGRVRDGLVQQGQPDLEVFAEWCERDGQHRRAGLRHSGREWQARLDSEPVSSLAELCTALAVLSFEPGSHNLIAGGSEPRRQFIDWALFHVEPDFLHLWRRYSRALKQRNALLKGRPRADLLLPWNRELADAGEPITRMRALYMKQIEPLLARAASCYLPEVGALRLEFRPGWRREEQSLEESLAKSMDRDLMFGHSGTGPHRADWRIEFERLPGRSALSRGPREARRAVLCLGTSSGICRCHRRMADHRFGRSGFGTRPNASATSLALSRSLRSADPDNGDRSAGSPCGVWTTSRTVPRGTRRSSSAAIIPATASLL